MYLIRTCCRYVRRRSVLRSCGEARTRPSVRRDGSEVRRKFPRFVCRCRYLEVVEVMPCWRRCRRTCCILYTQRTTRRGSIREARYFAEVYLYLVRTFEKLYVVVGITCDGCSRVVELYVAVMYRKDTVWRSTSRVSTDGSSALHYHITPNPCDNVPRVSNAWKRLTISTITCRRRSELYEAIRRSKQLRIRVTVEREAERYRLGGRHRVITCYYRCARSGVGGRCIGRRSDAIRALEHRTECRRGKVYRTTRANCCRRSSSRYRRHWSYRYCVVSRSRASTVRSRYGVCRADAWCYCVGCRRCTVRPSEACITRACSNEVY